MTDPSGSELLDGAAMNKPVDRGVDFFSPAAEEWHLNGFNLCEIIVIRDGPAPDGKTYRDGRHQVRVALFDNVEDARRAVYAANECERWRRCALAAIEGLTPRDVNERRLMELVLTRILK